MIESCKFILSNFTENERVKINKELINLVAKHGININRNFSVNGQKYVVIYTEDKIEFWYGNFFDNPDFKLTTYQDFMDKYGKTEQNNQKETGATGDYEVGDARRYGAVPQDEGRIKTPQELMLLRDEGLMSDRDKEPDEKQKPNSTPEQIKPSVVNIDENPFPHRMGWFKEV